MKPKILFCKPPDRFLENEFSYQQLGPHYLQSYLLQNGIESDILILYEDKAQILPSMDSPDRVNFSSLNGLLLTSQGAVDSKFNPDIFEQYEIVAFSVMSPQAPDAYMLNKYIKSHFKNIITVIGGSHPRYYLDRVKALPRDISFDFIVPYDGWEPILSIASGRVKRVPIPTVLADNQKTLENYPPPTRHIELMKRFEYKISGLPAFHTVTALGCPFTWNLCESGREKVRSFSMEMVDQDLAEMARVHEQLGNTQKAVMFFDDVGLLSPNQVGRLSSLVSKHSYDAWRAFTHAYLIVRFKDALLKPFVDSGGKRVGVGLETGSQKSLDLINKRNGKRQLVQDHIESVLIANQLGVAVDSFTMIYPWEDEGDLAATTEMIEVIMSNPVNGVDHLGRPLKNYVDSTIMTPYQGTEFYDMAARGDLPFTTVKPNVDPGELWYKGHSGGSGWPYINTRLPRERYEQEQLIRNSLRGTYR